MSSFCLWFLKLNPRGCLEAWPTFSVASEAPHAVLLGLKLSEEDGWLVEVSSSRENVLAAVPIILLGVNSIL